MAKKRTAAQKRATAKMLASSKKRNKNPSRRKTKKKVTKMLKRLKAAENPMTREQLEHKIDAAQDSDRPSEVKRLERILRKLKKKDIARIKQLDRAAKKRGPRKDDLYDTESVFNPRTKSMPAKIRMMRNGKVKVFVSPDIRRKIHR